MASPDDDLLRRLDTRLRSIQHYPRQWPNARDIEGLLLRDCHEYGEESPWMGGTKATAEFIADAPLLLREARARIAQLGQKNDRLSNDIDAFNRTEHDQTGAAMVWHDVRGNAGVLWKRPSAAEERLMRGIGQGVAARLRDKNLNLIRQALDANGWFSVIDYLVHTAEDAGQRQLAQELDRVATYLRIEIECLGGSPDYVR